MGRLTGARFRYDDGTWRGRFIASHVVGEMLIGHLTVAGERKRRAWLADPAQLQVVKKRPLRKTV